MLPPGLIGNFGMVAHVGSATLRGRREGWGSAIKGTPIL